jgi:hypothetical protein
MACQPRPIRVALLVLLASIAANAAETGAPSPISEVGATEKNCQLSGDIDWETGRPTPGRTLTNFWVGPISATRSSTVEN